MSSASPRAYEGGAGRRPAIADARGQGYRWFGDRGSDAVSGPFAAGIRSSAGRRIGGDLGEAAHV